MFENTKSIEIENANLTQVINDLHEIITNLETRNKKMGQYIQKQTKKIHLMKIYGSFSDDDIHLIDEGL